MKALDTNVIVRFLLNDDPDQSRRVKELFEEAERSGARYVLTTVVLLELIWVLSAVYELTRDDVLEALESLTQMPILEFEDYDGTQQLIRLARSTSADLPDLLIGLSARSWGCDGTLTFDRGLAPTGSFQQL